MAITSVPIRTNPQLRESKLMNSIFSYVKKSMLTIVRAVIMYRPLMFFLMVAMFFILVGVAIGVRFMIFYFQGSGSGHIQSLILATMMIVIGCQTFVTGLQADIISANRKLLEDIQFRVKKLELGLLDAKGTMRKADQETKEVEE